MSLSHITKTLMEAGVFWTAAFKRGETYIWRIDYDMYLDEASAIEAAEGHKLMGLDTKVQKWVLADERKIT